MLPRWFRLLLAVDAVLILAVCVLGARLALDGGRAAGRVITWAHPAPASAPPSAAGDAIAPASPPGGPPGGEATGPRPGPALLGRLDSDTAASANAQRGLLGMLEEAIRQRIAGILDRVIRSG